MRIAFVTFEYPPNIIGGAGIHAYHITRELANLGHQVVIFTPSFSGVDNEGDLEKPLQIIRVPVYNVFLFKALQFWLRLPGTVKKAEREKKFDILHFNGISYGFLKQRIARAPHVLTVHHLVKDVNAFINLSLVSRWIDMNGETGFFLSFIEERSILSADKIIAVSYFTQDQIIKRYSVASDRIEVIYNGVDQSFHSFSPEEQKENRNQFGIRDMPVILFVGRVNDYRKGLDILIKAFEKVLKTVDATLLVVGKSDKAYPYPLPQQLREKIIFTGFVERETLQKLYEICDVYVSPSRLEGFGLTIIEAFAAGKPVVATNVGAIPELIQHGKNGSLVAINDIDGMAEAIIFYLKDPSLSKAIGKTNKKTVKELFSWRESAKKLERIYGNL